MVFEGPVKIQSGSEGSASVYACCLACGTGERVPAMTLKSPKPMGGFCWASGTLPCCDAHTTSRGVGRVAGGTVTLDSTWPAVAPPRPSPRPSQQRPNGTSPTAACEVPAHQWDFHGVWEEWGYCPLVREKECSRWWEWIFLLKISAEDCKYKTRETETSAHICVFKKYSKGLKLMLRIGIIIACFTEPNHLNVQELPLRSQLTLHYLPRNSLELPLAGGGRSSVFRRITVSSESGGFYLSCIQLQNSDPPKHPNRNALHKNCNLN